MSFPITLPEEFIFSYNNQDLKSLGEAIAESKSLKKLKIDTPSEQVMRTLAPALATCNSLLELDLSTIGFFHEIKKISDECLQMVACAIGNNKSLRVLRLDAPVNIIKIIAQGIEKNASLQGLDFVKGKLGSEGASILAKVIKNKALLWMDLTDNVIGPDGAQILALSIETITTLQSLYLTGNNLGDAGVKAILPFIEKTISLEALHLGSNNINDDGIIALTNTLRKNKSIYKLCLKYNKFGGEGAKALADLLIHNKNIISVGCDDYNTYINDKKLLEKIRYHEKINTIIFESRQAIAVADAAKYKTKHAIDYGFFNVIPKIFAFVGAENKVDGIMVDHLLARRDKLVEQKKEQIPSPPSISNNEKICSK